MIKQFGYPFINSSKFSEMLEEMQNFEKTALLEINNPKLSFHYNLENELHEKRETEMLQNIYNYSEQFLFDKALFICGAEHKKGIIKKIAKFEQIKKVKINWTFYEG